MGLKVFSHEVGTTPSLLCPTLFSAFLPRLLRSLPIPSSPSSLLPVFPVTLFLLWPWTSCHLPKQPDNWRPRKFSHFSYHKKNHIIPFSFPKAYNLWTKWSVGKEERKVERWNQTTHGWDERWSRLSHKVMTQEDLRSLGSPLCGGQTEESQVWGRETRSAQWHAENNLMTPSIGHSLEL